MGVVSIPDLCRQITGMKIEKGTLHAYLDFRTDRMFIQINGLLGPRSIHKTIIERTALEDARQPHRYIADKISCLVTDVNNREIDRKYGRAWYTTYEAALSAASTP